MERIKVLVVGDKDVGKNSLLYYWDKLRFQNKDTPLYYDYSKIVDVDGVDVEVKLSHISGQEEYDRLRTLMYTDTDVFIVVFSLVCRTSFENVHTLWNQRYVISNHIHIRKKHVLTARLFLALLT